MIKILKNEFIKTLSSKKFYILNILIILAMVSDVILFKGNAQEFEINQNNIFIQAIFGQAMRPLLPILMLVVIASIFTDDYVKGTLKFTLMAGVTRTEIVLGKLIFTALYALIFMLVTFLSTYITITLTFGIISIHNLLFDLKICAIVLIPFIGFSVVISFIAILIKNSGILISIGTVLYIVMMVIDMSVKNAMYFSFSGGMYGCYFAKSYSNHTILLFYSTAFIYIAVFSMLDLIVFKKKDIVL